MTKESDDDRVVVVTYNLLNGQALAGSPRSWDRRREAVARAIRHCAPDLLGVQECFDYQARFLAQALPGYAWTGLGREADGSGEMAALLYRQDLFEERASGHFWLSETPDQPGSRSWDTHCTRVATWARLRRRASGRELLFANTHLDHGSESARLGGARLLVQRLSALAAGAPLILTGDFNACGEGSETWAVCVDGGLRDAWVTAPAVAGPEETWSDFRPPRYAGGERIDWVLLQGPVTARFCETVAYREADGFPSDHLPVRAVLQLERLPESTRELGGPAVQQAAVLGDEGGHRAAVIQRSAARALLVTPQGEVLLMCAVDPGDGHQVWFTPGGGLEPGETDADGLRRELTEETGRSDFALGPQVWKRFHAFAWGDRRIHQRERFYLVPVPRFVPHMGANPEATELLSFREYRWWTADEIAASPALFAPRRLAELLRRLLRDGPPPCPVDAGV